MRRLGLSALTALVLLLTGAGVARADVLASVPAPTTVAAGHGVIAWSTLDPADGRYWLTAWVGGVVGRLPISPRSVPFDVAARPPSPPQGSRLIERFPRPDQPVRSSHGPRPRHLPGRVPRPGPLAR
jgi:hypothetical protein